MPAVSGLQYFSVIPGDRQILIDGDTSKVFVNSSADTLTWYQKQLSESRANFEVFPPVPQLKVMADIGCVEGIAAALRGMRRVSASSARRSKYLLAGDRSVKRSRPSATPICSTCVRSAVSIRLLDLGANKAAA
jgi:hypothetical protein